MFDSMCIPRKEEVRMITTRAASKFAFALTIVAALLGVCGVAQAAPPDTPAIPLNTGQESPAPSVGGAHGKFSYDIDGTELCYSIEVTGLSAPAVAAHIHIGERNVPGPVVVPLTVPPATTFEVSACTTASATLLAAIQADPSAYYINVHTSTNPPGEVRGQLK
jgi:hypothetical protein